MPGPQLNSVLSDVESRIRRGRDVWITGPAGSGRNTIAHDLAERFQDAITLQPPPVEDLDASAALLLGACAGVERAEPNGASRNLYDAAGRPSALLRGALGERSRVLIVRLRSRPPGGVAGPELTSALKSRMKDAVSALRAARHPIVWVADPAVDPTRLGMSPDRVELSDYRAAFDMADWRPLECQRLWDFARRVAGQERSPIVWRLAAGVIHLGGDPAQVAAATTKATAAAVFALAKEVAGRIHQDRALVAGVQRMMLLRAAIPLSLAQQFSRVEPEHAALVFQCLAYGDPVRMHPVVAAALAQAELPCTAERDNFEAAKAFAQLDGATDPWSLDVTQAHAWVEKLHHLSAAGELGAAEWSRQTKPAPQWYWDRARSLSATRDWPSAANVYQDCLRQFPNDAYAHHYLAWNLEQARPDSAAIRQHYADAVRCDPANAWWNSRLICHLIRADRWTEAARAWRTAIDALDPDGSRCLTDAWLVSHLHFWVAKAWMDREVWYEARRIVAGIGRAALRQAESARSELGSLTKAIDDCGAQEKQAFEDYLSSRATAAEWRRAETLWHRLLEAVPELPPPSASDGEDGPRFVWSQPGIAFELELEPDGNWSWGAHDHLADEGNGGALAQGQFTTEFANWLQRLA